MLPKTKMNRMMQQKTLVDSDQVKLIPLLNPNPHDLIPLIWMKTVIYYYYIFISFLIMMAILTIVLYSCLLENRCNYYLIG